MSQDEKKLWGHYDFVGHDYETVRDAPAHGVIGVGDYESIERRLPTKLPPIQGQLPPIQGQLPAIPVTNPVFVGHSGLGNDAPASGTSRPKIMIPLGAIWAIGGLALGLVVTSLVASRRR